MIIILVWRRKYFTHSPLSRRKDININNKRRMTTDTKNTIIIL